MPLVSTPFWVSNSATCFAADPQYVLPQVADAMDTLVCAIKCNDLKINDDMTIRNPGSSLRSAIGKHGPMLDFKKFNKASKETRESLV